jgi:phosphoglycolate phosphatase-like HAD superfamily hydrolase
MQQRNKVQNIDWGEVEIMDIVYANQIEPKPSSAGVFHIMKKYDLRPDEIVFIGDSDVDRESAYNAGISFIHVDKLKKYDGRYPI